MSAEENKAIQEMDHEEVEAALPKLREEAVKADARVHQAMERLAQTAEVPTYVADRLMKSATYGRRQADSIELREGSFYNPLLLWAYGLMILCRSSTGGPTSV